MTKRLKLTIEGFTIIELMVAMTVFSVILIITTSGLIQIGRIYQKGIVRSQTQETARSAIVNIAELIQFNGGNVFSITDSGDAKGYCVDNKRISYRPDKKLVTDTPATGETRYALVIDTVRGCSTTSLAQDLSGSTATGTELLAPNMSVKALTIDSEGNGLYTVAVSISYGDADLLDGSGNCIPSRIGGSYCATSKLETTVQKRIVGND